MTKDIKEILDITQNADYKKLSIDAIIVIKDYITNLQEENERLKEILHWKQIENNIFYKSRIDKAIEYIERVIELNKLNDLNSIQLFPLLNILKGSDKK